MAWTSHYLDIPLGFDETVWQLDATLYSTLPIDAVCDMELVYHTVILGMVQYGGTITLMAKNQISGISHQEDISGADSFRLPKIVNYKDKYLILVWLKGGEVYLDAWYFEQDDSAIFENHSQLADSNTTGYTGIVSAVASSDATLGEKLTVYVTDGTNVKKVIYDLSESSNILSIAYNSTDTSNYTSSYLAPYYLYHYNGSDGDSTGEYYIEKIGVTSYYTKFCELNICKDSIYSSVPPMIMSNNYDISTQSQWSAKINSFINPTGETYKLVTKIDKDLKTHKYFIWHPGIIVSGYNHDWAYLDTRTLSQCLINRSSQVDDTYPLSVPVVRYYAYRSTSATLTLNYSPAQLVLIGDRIPSRTTISTGYAVGSQGWISVAATSGGQSLDYNKDFYWNTDGSLAFRRLYKEVQLTFSVDPNYMEFVSIKGFAFNFDLPNLYIKATGGI